MKEGDQDRFEKNLIIDDLKGRKREQDKGEERDGDEYQWKGSWCETREMREREER